MNTTHQSTLFARWKFLKDADLPADVKREQMIYVQQQILAIMGRKPWNPGPTVLGGGK